MPPLTPEDVRNKTFTPVRLREGYDMGEVDNFLDEVERTLQVLTEENDDLRQKLVAAQRGDAFAGPPVPDLSPPEIMQPPVPQVAPGGPPPQSVAEASNAAARLLEIATQNADQLVGESKEQANRVLSEARTRAERIENEARGMASRVESDARAKADALERETDGKRSQLFGQLEKEKARLQREVDELRSFERQYRSRLKAYFESQLRVLNGQAGSDQQGQLAAAEQGGPRGMNPHQQMGNVDRIDRRERAVAGTPRLNTLMDDEEDTAL